MGYQSPRWTAHDIPDQAGHTAVITGANSGIGYAAAQALAQHGAHVVLACRNLDKATAAAAAIRQATPGATVEAMALDLASLASVRQFAAEFAQRFDALHLLINNAGVMALPYRKTADGFEMQFGTNHLGHFALTGLLLERLLRAPGARVVTVSSGLHHRGHIQFDDLQSERGYGKWQAYSQSKLANLLFAYELQRLLAAAGAEASSVACHPGYAATNLQTAGPAMENASIGVALTRIGNALFAQSAAMGALPTLYAATAPDVQGGDYIGPNGWMEMRGYPAKVQSSARSHDQAAAARLWAVSTALTGVEYTDLQPHEQRITGGAYG